MFVKAKKLELKIMVLILSLLNPNTVDCSSLNQTIPAYVGLALGSLTAALFIFKNGRLLVQNYSPKTKQFVTNRKTIRNFADLAKRSLKIDSFTKKQFKEFTKSFKRGVNYMQEHQGDVQIRSKEDLIEVILKIAEKYKMDTNINNQSARGELKNILNRLATL